MEIIDTTERFVQLDELMPIIREQLETGGTVRFSPQGISMLPMLRQGVDSVILSPVKKELKKYDLPLYRRDNGKYILHRIVKVGETYTCMGDNQFQKETGISQDQVIAYVSSFYRGEKEYRVDDVRYLLYCRIWHFMRPIRRMYRKFKSLVKRFIRSLP